jgi:uncharacterized protein YoxC
MADVISLEEYRERRDPLLAAVRRLDAAVSRLDPLVRDRGGRLTPSIERELAAISRAVSSGDPRDAAERAERLADLLEHPAVGGGA